MRALGNVNRMERNVGTTVAWAAVVFYWIAYALTTQSVVSLPRHVEPFSDSAAPLLFGIGIALAAGLYVGQWWVLVAAISPLIPLLMLQIVGHTTPYGDDAAPLAGWHWWLASIAIPLAMGVGIRKGLGPSRRRSTRALTRSSRVSEP